MTSLHASLVDVWLDTASSGWNKHCCWWEGAMLDTTPRFRSVNQPTHVVSPRSPAMVYTCLSQLSEERTNALFFLQWRCVVWTVPLWKKKNQLWARVLVWLTHLQRKNETLTPRIMAHPTAIASALDACGNKKFIKPACISSQTWQQEIQK